MFRRKKKEFERQVHRESSAQEARVTTHIPFFPVMSAMRKPAAVVPSSENLKDERTSHPVVTKQIPQRIPPSATQPVRLADGFVGGHGVFWAGGPKAVQSPDQIVRLAYQLKDAGIQFLRASVPSKSGVRIDPQKLRFFRRVAERFDLRLLVEVFSEDDLDLITPGVDVLELSSPNIFGDAMFQKLATLDVPILFHRDPKMSLDSLRHLLQPFEESAQSQVILVESGNAGITADGGSGLDFSSIVMLRRETHYPVIVNCASVVQDWTFTESMVFAALGVGAHGFLLEISSGESAVEVDPTELLPGEVGPMIKRVDALKSTLNALQHVQFGRCSVRERDNS